MRDVNLREIHHPIPKKFPAQFPRRFAQHFRVKVGQRASCRGEGDMKGLIENPPIAQRLGRAYQRGNRIYFKLYKGQLSVVERALETAALMLGSDKSRGYSLEMICADFLAGASLETDNSINSHKSSASIGCAAATRRPSDPTERPT